MRASVLDEQLQGFNTANIKEEFEILHTLDVTALYIELQAYERAR